MGGPKRSTSKGKEPVFKTKEPMTKTKAPMTKEKMPKAPVGKGRMMSPAGQKRIGVKRG